jgi:hypothetical protein
MTFTEVMIAVRERIAGGTSEYICFAIEAILPYGWERAEMKDSIVESLVVVGDSLGESAYAYDSWLVRSGYSYALGTARDVSRELPDLARKGRLRWLDRMIAAGKVVPPCPPLELEKETA